MRNQYLKYLQALGSTVVMHDSRNNAVTVIHKPAPKVKEIEEI